MYATHPTGRVSETGPITIERIELHVARARHIRAKATADGLKALGRRLAAAGQVLRLWRPGDEEPAEAHARRPHLTVTEQIERRKEERARRQRMVRELEAYSDRDLEELGIVRADIPGFARLAA